MFIVVNLLIKLSYNILRILWGFIVVVFYDGICWIGSFYNYMYIYSNILRVLLCIVNGFVGFIIFIICKIIIEYCCILCRIL